MEDGLYIWICNDCGKEAEREIYPATGHYYEEEHHFGLRKSATPKHDGIIYYPCIGCEAIGSEKIVTIYSPNNLELSETKLAYNGKIQKPKVKVYDRIGKRIPANYYKVKYSSDSKAIGKYHVTITFRQPADFDDDHGIFPYEGSITKTYQLTPKPVSLKQVAGKKKGLKLYWNKVSQISGYQIRYSKSADMSDPKVIKVASSNVSSYTISSLKAKTRYYLQIRTYKKTGSNIIFSKWSDIKNKKTK